MSAGPMTTGQDEPVAPPAGVRDVLSALGQPKVFIAMIFGVATGMPPVMVGPTLGFWLRQEGIALATIGFMTWVGVFFATKFLWAPYVDRIQLPLLGKRLGHRRSWMLVGQVGVAIGIVGMALVGPSGGLALFAGFAMFAAFSSATQDIAVDAWRIEVASDREQDLVAAAYIFGLRGGYFLGNVPLLAASHYIGWQTTYLIAAGGAFIGLTATLLAKEPQITRNFAPFKGPADLFATFLYPVRVFWEDYGKLCLLILPLVMLFFLPDGLITPMVAPLYIDLGYTAPEIAGVRTVFGITMTMVGVVTAGLIGMRIGTLTTMAIAVTLSGVSNLGFTLLALSGGERPLWIGVVMFEAFSAGMANASMVAWAGRLTNPKATAAQFAMLSSLMVLLGGVFAGFSGMAIEALQARLGDPMLGFGAYFAATTLVCLVPLILIILVARAMKRRAQLQSAGEAASAER